MSSTINRNFSLRSYLYAKYYNDSAQSRLKRIKGFYLDTGVKKNMLPAVLFLREQRFYRYMDRIYSPVPITALSAEQSTKLCEIRLDYFDEMVDESLNLRVFDHFFQYGARDHSSLRLLDFGCGNGYFTHILKEKFEPMAITGVDISDKAISSAQSKFSDISWLKITSTSGLPYPANHFDMIISSFVMHFNIHPHLIKELYRVLCPKGMFLFNIYNKKYFQPALLKKLKDAGFIIDLLPSPDEKYSLYYCARK